MSIVNITMDIMLETPLNAHQFGESEPQEVAAAPAGAHACSAWDNSVRPALQPVFSEGGSAVRGPGFDHGVPAAVRVAPVVGEGRIL